MELVGILAQRKAEAAAIKHSAVDKPHRGDETDCTEHTDGREVLLGVHPVVLQDGERHRVGQGQRGHVECHAEGVDGNKHRLIGYGGAHAHIGKVNHRCTSNQVADAQQTLRLDVLVGDNTHESGHENRHDALDGIEPRDFGTHACTSQIVAHAGEIGTPHSELQEIHHDESQLKIFHKTDAL